jgi:hypothetical protein
MVQLPRVGLPARPLDAQHENLSLGRTNFVLHDQRRLEDDPGFS